MRASGRLAAALVAAFGAGASLAPPAFSHDGGGQPLSELPTLEGYTFSRPRYVSEWGTIAGQVARVGQEPNEQAVLWRRHHGGFQIEVLPPLFGFLRGDARSFARLHTPVGISYFWETQATTSRAVAWPKDPATHERVAVDLEPPAGFTDAQAYAGNVRGLIAGEASNPREIVNGLPVRHAVVWHLRHDGSAEVCDLGVPEGFDDSSASDINAFGLVVGTARRLEPADDGRVRLRADVVVWRPAEFPRHCPYEPIMLPAREDLPVSMTPAINHWGQVSARADRVVAGQRTVSRALVWSWSHQGYGLPVELPVPEGFTDAIARDLNTHGQVVGSVLLRPGPGPAATSSRAAIWKRKHGRWRVKLLPSPGETALVSGDRINERGDVVGNSPAPAPGSTGGLLWRDADGHSH